MKLPVLVFGALGALCLLSPALAAPPPPEYVQFSPGATKGAFYRPDPEAFPDAHIGVLVMHRTSNFLSHVSTRELSNRGFYVLAVNPRCDNNEAACAPWEDNALDAAQGMRYLRENPDIEQVVLLGHSGGGPAMSFYQAVAEAGAAFCQDEAKLVACGDGFDDLPAADGLILMDAHPGFNINNLRNLFPNVTNDAEMLESNAAPAFDMSLDPFSPEHGFAADGSSYPAEFLAAYHAAQADRMNVLIDIALDRLAHIEENDLGDAPFVVRVGTGARLMQTDLSIHGATLAPQKLLRDDGSIVDDQVVESVRVATLRPSDPDHFDRTLFLTVKSFLSGSAIRATDSMDGVDWCSSNNSTPCNLQEIGVPLLVTAMAGHYFVRDSEQFFEMAASQDKDFVVIEGANHNGGPCVPCETTPGQYSNATANLFDYMAEWMNARF